MSLRPRVRCFDTVWTQDARHDASSDGRYFVAAALTDPSCLRFVPSASRAGRSAVSLVDGGAESRQACYVDRRVTRAAGSCVRSSCSSSEPSASQASPIPCWGFSGPAFMGMHATWANPSRTSHSSGPPRWATSTSQAAELHAGDPVLADVVRPGRESGCPPGAPTHCSRRSRRRGTIAPLPRGATAPGADALVRMHWRGARDRPARRGEQNWRAVPPMLRMPAPLCRRLVGRASAAEAVDGGEAQRVHPGQTMVRSGSARRSSHRPTRAKAGLITALLFGDGKPNSPALICIC